MPPANLPPTDAPPPIRAQQLYFAQYQDLEASARTWLGDFSIPGFGAGNVRIGPSHDPDWGNPCSIVFIFDCNLINLQRLQQELRSATLVLGARDFHAQAGSGLPREGVEIPLTKVVEMGGERRLDARPYQRVLVPDSKLLAAAVATSDLRALSAGRGLSIYARLETTEGMRWVNRDGVPYRNFDLSEEILWRPGS